MLAALFFAPLPCRATPKKESASMLAGYTAGMVRWYHSIFSAYGFWLPNDPRGSWSGFVHAWELFRFAGPATTVTGKRSYARDVHDVQKRRAAKEFLKHPPARFDEACRASIGLGFARACAEFGFVVYACAIGHDHAHAVLGRDPHSSGRTGRRGVEGPRHHADEPRRDTPD